MDMDLLERDKLLNFKIDLSDSQISQLIRFLIEIDYGEFTNIKREHIILYIHDMWSLLEYGDDYKSAIRDSDVKIKLLRLFIVDYIAENKQYKKNKLYLSTSTFRNFYISILIIKAVLKDYNENLEYYPVIADIQTKFHNTKVKSNEEDYLRQQQLINEIRASWYKNFYKLNQNHDKYLINIIDEVQSAEHLIGGDFWGSISQEDMPLLLNCLESGHFSEVQFWKEKLLKVHKLQSIEKDQHTYVYCVQQDKSMQGHFNLQTALALTVSEFSMKYENDFIFLSFAQTIEKETIALNGKISSENYFELIKKITEKEFTEDGPINYKNVLNFAFTLMKLELSSTTGSIILYCNELLFENLPKDEKWQLAVKSFKKENNIEITLVYLGDKNKVGEVWFADMIILGGDLMGY